VLFNWIFFLCTRLVLPVTKCYTQKQEDH
jgi:hypothetical protein